MSKYRAFPRPAFNDRTWPSKTIEKAPVWCNVDLRDGNQSLANPMNPVNKLKWFKTITSIGFKEIEISFPSASQQDYDFTRLLIENNHIPDDVTVQVLTQARAHLIHRTFEALAGVKRAIFHIYNSTSPAQRQMVFQKSTDEIIAIAIEGVKLVRELAKKSGSEIILEYSPESFSQTELTFASEICNAVVETWAPSADERVIINLPSTVEVASPHIYADQVEYMCRQLEHKNVIISVHTHNDRGCAVAAAELAQCAGASRVEGTMFGNGERTGNADLVTLALNCYTQGIDPGLDFSNISDICTVYSECTGMTIPVRQPYTGELVFTAFSGSHQDAISKSLAHYSKKGGVWDIPYLPIDPADINRDYQSVIRINSQSGKGGAAYILEQHYGVCIPREMQSDLGEAIKNTTAIHNRELSANDVHAVFRKTFFDVSGPYKIIQISGNHERVTDNQDELFFTAIIATPNGHIHVGTKKSTIIDKIQKSIDNVGIKTEFSISQQKSAPEQSAQFRVYAKAVGTTGIKRYGAAHDDDFVVAVFNALCSALNRFHEVPCERIV